MASGESEGEGEDAPPEPTEALDDMADLFSKMRGVHFAEVGFRAHTAYSCAPGHATSACMHTTTATMLLRHPVPCAIVAP